jgi:Leucine-rich repeat (LRR) protein
VSNLTNLTDLELEYNQISDISALPGLTNLWFLDLDNNQISDISALSNLVNLMYLYLEFNQINDLGALVSNTGLGTTHAFIFVDSNPLSCAAVNIEIPELLYEFCTVTYLLDSSNSLCTTPTPTPVVTP